MSTSQRPYKRLQAPTNTERKHRGHPNRLHCIARPHLYSHRKTPHRHTHRRLLSQRQTTRPGRISPRH
nr:MAG TPA: hypothetical protein [Caudoviricetes sp.]